MDQGPTHHEPADHELAAEYGIDPDVLRAVPDHRFALVNFFRLREHADDGTDVEPRTGLAAMLQYARASGPRLEAAGGRFLTQGLSAGTLWGTDDHWDIVVVAEYPDRDAFRALLTDPDYRAAFADRRAAVAAQRVVLSVAVDT